MTSPGRRRGSIEPVITVVGCHPMTAGAAAQRARPRSVTTTPRASVATPNIPEARALTGLGEEATQAELAAAFRALGPAAVVVTGGHDPDGLDMLDDGADEPFPIAGPVHPGGGAHGSGCPHSSPLAAQPARGEPLRVAAAVARQVAARAVADALRDVGAGAGPVDVFGVRRAS